MLGKEQVNQYRVGPWLVVAAAMLWAVDAPFRKFLTGDLSSTTIVFMEHLFAAGLALFLIVPRLKELKKLGWKEWASIIMIALGGSALATIFFTQSFRYVNPSVAILLQKIQPLIAITLAAMMLKEKLTQRFWIWAIVAIGGAYLVTLPDISASGLHLAGGSLGVILALSAAALWAAATVFGRYAVEKLSFQTVTALRFIAALFFLFVIELYYRRLAEVAHATPKDWLFVGIIAVLAGFISLFLYYRGLKFTKASVATIGELAFPFSAVVVNWIFLDAKLTAVQIAGGLVLLVAMLQLGKVNTADKAR